MKQTLSGKETAFFNAAVYTMDEHCPRAEAFVVKDGRFCFVGRSEDVANHPNRVDLQGRCVIPGLIDSHCHAFAGVSRSLLNVVELDPATTPEELGEALLAALPENAYEDDTPLAAMGLDLTRGSFSARDIDSAIPNRSVAVFTGDGHALLLNTRAMEELGIDRNTEDYGRDSYFERDSEGNPTGLVVEVQAMLRCRSLLDAAANTDADLTEIFDGLLGAYAALGYTTIFEAMSVDNDDASRLEALRRMDGDGRLPLRVSASFGYHGEDVLPAKEAVGLLRNLRERFTSPHLSIETLKLFTDGTVEERTALLYEPYADAPDANGSEAAKELELAHAAALAAEEGMSLHIHAIGDKAAGRALRILRGVKTKGTKTIAHNQLYGPAEIESIAAAGDIFFQTTPHWAVADNYTEQRLGPERYLRQFPVATMLRHGVTVSFGSDSCLEPETANPFLGMYYAEARGDAVLCRECYPPRSEGISRMDSLRAYTVNGARQLGLEEETGSITVGKSADFVILDRDIMTCPLPELKEMETSEVWFCGKRTFSKP
ncbi:MAG: amidohydrolase family protein [Oscillospiraceae bacterium]|nr:amidohydrolase family protein [Oscillospiraceae bacterium]